MTCRKRGVDRLVASLENRAGDRHHRLQPRLLDSSETRVRGVDDALGQPVMITQIDEDELSMVALAVDPSRKTNRVANMGFGKLAACM